MLKELGWEHEEHDGLVYLWPQAHRDLPPLVLRLIVLRRDKQEIYLLTNVFDPQRLSDEDAGVLYEMRWGIEVFYRSYKQTLCRRRLLSRTPATCLAECQWTMLGLWLLGLMTVKQLVAKRLDPLGWSVALGGMRFVAPCERRLAALLAADYFATWHPPSRTGTSVAARKPPGTTLARSEKSRPALPKSNRLRRRKSN